MSIKAFFSNRVYKNTLPKEFVDAISHALFVFNSAKHFSFSTSIKEKRSGLIRRSKSMHLTVKERFKLDDYYANSVVQEANAMQKSLFGLNKLYISNKEIQITSVKHKLKKVKARLTTLKKIKTSFIKGKPSFPKSSNVHKVGSFFAVTFKKKTDIYYHAYQFEHEYLDREIKKLKTRIGFLSLKLHKYEKQLKKLKTDIRSVVFGSKKLFKSQYTKNEFKDNHQLWVKKWEHARYNQMTISGRKDSSHGNFVFQYDLQKHQLSFKTPSDVRVEINEIHFPYGQKVVEDAILNQLNCNDKKKFGKPIAWSVEDHGAYYIIKCMINVDAKQYINYSKSDGIIGVDCNVDHFAVSDINSKGQLISSRTLKFNIVGKTSGQITKIIESEVMELVNIAERANKPLAIEKLDTTSSKVSNAYGNKKANLKFNMFAYHKKSLAIKSRAEKMGVAVFEVNPAYTSQIGKMKYMKRFGISIHEAASFVIARRAMGFKEKLPPVLGTLLPEKMVGTHHWAQWGYISKMLKGIRTCAYYRSELFNVDKFRSTNEFFLPGALTDLEAKSLLKLKSGKTSSQLSGRRSCTLGICLALQESPTSNKPKGC
ncbi:IS200/IS605 family accessory protein TnpB-related protein [Bacillus sp. EB600]|uniref:IS200/IS605 family accessory protein TnpB-related protein n=1 Tax=Bacillus sp. EB600 TaxID=2806345 RepID=UPI00210B0EF9|nr:IS200/IS605 family accessory protein TnpB-related protein [Bacillus sp. EB600]MCQ6278614.1 IS200/IS605 family accessory protein TnpB-related protein [Bacillus sp. EB600]